MEGCGKMNHLTEDEVRDKAKNILNFGNDENVKSGFGQLTTFSHLGFDGILDKPDGWYLPENTSNVVIVVEVKNSTEDLSKQKWNDEILKNIGIVHQKYKRVVGILYNGDDVVIYKNTEKFKGKSESGQLFSY